MRKIFLLMSLALLFNADGFAETKWFLAKESNQMSKQEGADGEKRYAPESTFKIPLSLMGYGAKILKDEAHPE